MRPNKLFKSVFNKNLGAIDARCTVYFWNLNRLSYGFLLAMYNQCKEWSHDVDFIKWSWDIHACAHSNLLIITKCCITFLLVHVYTFLFVGAFFCPARTTHFRIVALEGVVLLSSKCSSRSIKKPVCLENGSVVVDVIVIVVVFLSALDVKALFNMKPQQS